uniref:T9SS type A sorting domain-containing protein n=1 Tax=Flavobacterium sp. TaxID=239 RepID=UPI003F69F619
YSIRVRIHSNAQQGSYGEPCNVYTPSIAITKILSCDATVDYNEIVYASAIPNANAYEFKIYDATGTTLLETIENNYNYFVFTQLNNYAYDTTYKVTVAVRIGTQYGDDSDPCNITIGPDPGQAPSRETIQDVGINNTSMTTKSEMSAYPNPFTTSFSISPLQGQTDDLSYHVYDATGKFIESKSVKANEISSQNIGNYYPTGMYLIVVKQGTITQTFKMIKQ